MIAHLTSRTYCLLCTECGKSFSIVPLEGPRLQGPGPRPQLVHARSLCCRLACASRSCSTLAQLHHHQQLQTGLASHSVLCLAPTAHLCSALQLLVVSGMWQYSITRSVASSGSSGCSVTGSGWCQCVQCTSVVTACATPLNLVHAV
jgi:hypothetical protein